MTTTHFSRQWVESRLRTWPLFLAHVWGYNVPMKKNNLALLFALAAIPVFASAQVLPPQAVTTGTVVGPSHAAKRAPRPVVTHKKATKTKKVTKAPKKAKKVVQKKKK